MTDKVALVTGASRGIGRAAAVHLSRAGFDVVLTARGEEDLAETRAAMSDGNHTAIVADLADAASAEVLASALDDITKQDVGQVVFIHCAAETADPEVEAHLGETDPVTIESHCRVTGLSGLLLLRALKPLMSKATRSSAVLITTDWLLANSYGPPAFTAAKAMASQAWRSATKEYLEVGCVPAVITAGDIATFDEDWEDPKWTVDSSSDEVREELGDSRVLLKDLIAAIDLIITTELSAITELSIRPLKADYAP